MYSPFSSFHPLQFGKFWMVILLCWSLPIVGQESTSPKIISGEKLLAEYFKTETAKLSQKSLSEFHSLKDWEAARGERKRQLHEMLGLDPLPKKSPLKAVVTKRLEREEFRVENIHFQSMPGLYVTGNLYLPKTITEKLPTILYVCGHGRVKKNGISYGNKTHYQHHGAWFARNGYVCFTIDTIQLGELEGIHHGTYRHKMWWWNNRGYTPAGVEAWNCIRSLDYLSTRKEVDMDRIGVTGRSGGGAYSWWICTLDERVKVAVPVAGITNLQNHVVDGCVEGHCDCMYMVNTYRWDYGDVAALMAPRPLLIANSDKDRIFPLEGVIDVHRKVRNIYRLYEAEKNLGLLITEGPHKDTQELRVPAFHWFNRFLKQNTSLIETTATKYFEPEELKVFEKVPEDEITTKIQESFTQLAATPRIPTTVEEFQKRKRTLLHELQQKCFRGWPKAKSDLKLKSVTTSKSDGVVLSAWDFESQTHVPLRLYMAYPERVTPDQLDLVVLNALDKQGWRDFLSTYAGTFPKELDEELTILQNPLPKQNSQNWKDTKKMFDSFKWGMVYLAPRGIGRTTWYGDERKETQIRRRFMLLGQTLDSMRVWDIRRGVQALRAIPKMSEVPLWMQGERGMAGLVLYASLFEKNITRLDLWHLPSSHQEGPIFLNVRRVLDLPEAVSLAASQSQVRLYHAENQEANWKFSLETSKVLGWDKKALQLRTINR